MSSPLLDSPAHDVRMSLAEHLEELRARLILGLLGVVVGSVLALFVGKQLYRILCIPLFAALSTAGLEPKVNFFNPAVPFTIYLKLSLVVGAVVAAPWVLYQLWKFVSVGMYESERRVVTLLVPFSAAMAALGVLFMYYFMLPICLWFFISFATDYPAAGEGEGSWLFKLLIAAQGKHAAPAPEVGPDDTGPVLVVPVRPADPASPRDGQIWINERDARLCVRLRGHTSRLPLDGSNHSMMQPLIGADDYISFVTMITLGIVVAFQLPVAMLVLGWTGLISPDLITRYRPYCVFGCFTLGAVLTPADPISMLVLSFPLWGLYELGVLLMRLMHRRAAVSPAP